MTKMSNEEAIKAIKDNYPSSGYTMLCEGLDIAIECIEKQMSMAKKLSEIEEVIYDYCDTMEYKIIMEKIADILGVELIQIGLE